MFSESSRFVVANWKMNGSSDLFASFVQKLSVYLRVNPVSCRVVLCPSAVLLKGFLSEKGLYHLGSQDCSVETEGAFTGDISAGMFKDVGCDYVIVGHSERRFCYNESNEVVSEKSTRALEAGLTPIICIGESHPEHLIEQLVEQLLECLPAKYDDGFIIAYEPCWAVGNTEYGIPNRRHMLEVVDLIRRYNTVVPILYGGSVSANNISQIVSYKGISGVLVGRVSMNIEGFCSVISAFSHEKVLNTDCRSDA